MPKIVKSLPEDGINSAGVILTKNTVVYFVPAKTNLFFGDELWF